MLTYIPQFLMYYSVYCNILPQCIILYNYQYTENYLIYWPFIYNKIYFLSVRDVPMKISRLLCLSCWMCLDNCLFLSVLVFRACLYNCFESLYSPLEDVLSCLWICLSNLTRHVQTASLDLEDISLKLFLGPFVQDNIFWQSSLFLFCYMGPVPTIISRSVCLNYRTWLYSSFSTVTSVLLNMRYSTCYI